MISVAMTMGATEETAGTDMKEVQDFEIQLANISTLSGDKYQISSYKIHSLPFFLLIHISKSTIIFNSFPF